MPENLELKKKVWQQIDTFVSSDDTILASSTSSMPASTFTSDLKHKAQCIVCHPVSIHCWQSVALHKKKLFFSAMYIFRQILHFIVH